MKKLLLLALIIPFSYYLKGQEITINTQGPPEPKFPSSLSEEDRERVLRSANNLMRRYAEAATLLDERERRVTVKSIDRFKSLFVPTAEVPKDYVEFVPETLESLNQYCDGIFRRLEANGVQVKLASIDLIDIIDDPAGFYVMNLKVEKLIYNYLPESGKMKVNPGGRPFKQYFKLDIPKDNLERIRILKIKGENVKPAADYVQYLGPSIGISNSFVNAPFSSFWTSNHGSPSDLSVKGGLGFSVGIDFMTNRLEKPKAPGKNLFLLAGLHFAQMRVNSSLTAFEVAPFEAVAGNSSGNTMNYKRAVSNLSATENMTVNMLNIPIGAAYRLKQSRKYEFFLAFRMLPTVVLSSAGSMTGKGNYSAILEEARWNSSRRLALNPSQLNTPDKYQPLLIGERNIDGVSNPTLRKFIMAFQLSPVMYLSLSDQNPSWNLLVGLDLTIQPGSVFNHDAPNQDLFTFPDDYSGSILTQYTSGMSTFSAGLRVGLQHRLSKRP